MSDCRCGHDRVLHDAAGRCVALQLSARGGYLCRCNKYERKYEPKPSQ